MTDNIAFIIKLEHRQVADLHYVTSPNFDGLHVCGTTVEGTYQSLIKVVKAMCRHNWGYDVNVCPEAIWPDVLASVTGWVREV